MEDVRIACGDPFGWLGRPAQELAPFPILLRTGPKRGGASSLDERVEALDVKTRRQEESLEELAERLQVLEEKVAERVE